MLFRSMSDDNWSQVLQYKSVFVNRTSGDPQHHTVPRNPADDLREQFKLRSYGSSAARLTDRGVMRAAGQSLLGYLKPPAPPTSHQSLLITV